MRKILAIIVLAGSFGLVGAAAEPLWSLAPVREAAPPVVKDKEWPRSDIDRFILAKLEAEGMKPVGDADPETLVRRLYFNLIGLPPTPAQIDAFDPTNMEKTVDELLKSPRFGEKRGRHWLDLARYADSNGKDRDVIFPNAWRYRDYVIASFNADKPYDQFVREQIAGDLFPDAGDEQIVATAFLTLGPKAFQERDLEKFAMDVVDEQIDVMSRSILGLTVACARCHDHKFDPIPTSDYYALAGIFLSSDTRYGPGPIYINKHEKDTHLVPIGDRVEELHPEVAAWRAEILRLTEEVANTRSAAYKIKRQVIGALRDKGLKKPEEDPELLKQHQESEALYAEADEKNEVRQKMIAEPPAEMPGYTMAILKSEETPEDCRIRVRGVHNDHGEAVARGQLSLPGVPKLAEIGGDESGRLQLAEWLTSPDNPLPARVMVNRVWHHLFGSGLVATVDNFGAAGETPSHPELLDFLAAEFVADGWSGKRLIRRIVLSRTWQLSSKVEGGAGNSELDPENRLLWRANFRRLDIEQFRDAVLMTSGEVRIEPPEKGMMAAVYAGKEWGDNANRVNFTDEIAADRHRTVYLPIVRNALPEFLQLFDFADPNAPTGDRNDRTIPSQALYLMNNPFVEEQARLAAERILRTPAKERIELAYRLTTGRKPSPTAAATAEYYLRSRTEESTKIDAWTDFIQTLYSSAQFRYLQ